jgi:hypothetical protein
MIALITVARPAVALAVDSFPTRGLSGIAQSL